MKSDPYHPSIVILGAGNVATHLAKALDPVSEIKQIYSRTTVHAQALASQLRGATPISNLSDLCKSADYYIISVRDDAIAEIAENMHGISGVLAHTSGSVPINALQGTSSHIGVLYPLQTFTKEAKLDISAVPFFIEGNDGSTREALSNLASLISKKIYYADSQQRSILHIAAVFACNFANHLWSIADELLKDNGYDMSVLMPLLEATLQKIDCMPPLKAQTGPAVRGDVKIISKHLDMLSSDEKEIYSLLSNSIIKKHNSTLNHEQH